MTDVPDARLLEQFARNGSEEAFAALVERHIALVHSVAMRHTANPQYAQDITQAVFIILARKAGTLGHKTVLPGWLYHTARLTAANLQRAETRRIRREQEAFMQYKAEESTTDALWRELSPQLDEAMAGLGTSDRDALVLRYFQNKSMAEVGKFLGLEENTAQKRVSRALERLRKFFTKRGVSLTTAVIAAAISANSVQAAPAALAKSVTTGAITKGAAASGSTLTVIKGALKIMAWTKAKTAIVVGAGLLLAAGTTTVAVKQIAHHQESSVWNHITRNDADQLRSAPPAVSIRSTQYAPGVRGWNTDGGKVLGLGQPFNVLVSIAYGVHATRIVPSTPLPQGEYDFIASIPQHQKESLQEAITRNYGLVGRREAHDTNVLLLTIERQSAPGLKATAENASSKTYSTRFGGGQIKCSNISLAELTSALESYLGEIPIVDKTGTTSRFDIEVHWNDSGTIHPSNPEGLRQALLDQLGLALVPGWQQIEMLMVEKMK